MILGIAWDAFFYAIYGDPAHFWFSWEVHEKQLLTLFTMILLIFLNICSCLEAAFVVKTRYLFYFSIFLKSSFCHYFLTLLGRVWEAVFDAIYGDPAHFVDLRTLLGSSFDAIYGDPANCCISWEAPGE